MKKRVGIVPPGRLFETEDPYQDVYVAVNSYSERVTATGGIPVGILPVNGLVNEETLEVADSFVICGGRRLHPYQLQVVEHCLRTGKRLLGVCLGMQAIHAYFLADDERMKRGWAGDILSLYEKMKKERVMFVLPVAHHWDIQMVRGRPDEVKHTVRLKPGSRIAELLGCETVMGASMHHYAVNAPSPRLSVTGVTPDGAIEALEYGRDIIGVQFHPEVDDKTDALFRFLSD